MRNHEKKLFDQKGDRALNPLTPPSDTAHYGHERVDYERGIFWKQLSITIKGNTLWMIRLRSQLVIIPRL